MDYTKKLPQENERLEYKHSKSVFPKDAWETVSSFQNTKGGLLILGISENDKHQFNIEGVKNVQGVLDSFWAGINDELLCSFNGVTNDDITTTLTHSKTIIEINIPRAPNSKLPVHMRNNIMNTYIRNGAVDAKASEDQIYSLKRMAERNNDTHVLKNYDIDDLDMNSIHDYKNLLIKRKRYSFYKDYSTNKFLKTIGVLSKDYENDGKIGLTEAGLLFFGKNNAIIHKFPNFQLEYYDKSFPEQDRWTSRISSVESDLNIFSFYKKVEEILIAKTPGPFKLNKDGQRIDTMESMKVALREALINMLMHADYLGNSPLIINNYSNHYEFLNPGEMLIPENDFFTTTKTATRNPTISKLFVQIGLGERAGQGGETIFESAQSTDLKQPEIKTDLNGTQLKIWKVDYADSISGEKISERERKILKAINNNGSMPLSRREIIKKTKLSASITTRCINSLLTKKLIIRVGKSSATKYGLPISSKQIFAQLQTMPDIFRKMLNKNN